MYKTISLFICFCWISVTQAGQLINIHLNQTAVEIEHQACQLQKPLIEHYKLILPLKQCQSQARKLQVNQIANLKQVHWAQHDKHTVWVVLTFKQPYQFELNTAQAQRIKICIPHCHTLSSLHNEPLTTLFRFQGIEFKIPLENMNIDQFLQKSIEFVPQDMVRDGLPHFGSKRDDWLGKTRVHKGYDIYVDKTQVLAAAEGIVHRVKTGYRSGLYVKLKHENNIYTLYVHLHSANVKEGEKVQQGQVIGRIDGATGNAIAPQLHFELKPRNQSIDPLPLIAEFYYQQPDILARIQTYQQNLPAQIQARDQAVKKYLEKHPIVPTCEQKRCQ